jgi:hypothetical protein
MFKRIRSFKMKRLTVVVFLSTFVLTSCSFGSPKIGGKCDPTTDSISENSHGQPLICGGKDYFYFNGVGGSTIPNPNYKKWTPYYPDSE